MRSKLPSKSSKLQRQISGQAPGCHCAMCRNVREFHGGRKDPRPPADCNCPTCRQSRGEEPWENFDSGE